MSITPRKHSWLTRLVLIVCSLSVAGLGIVAISLLVEGLDLRHHAARTTATVISFYRCCHGGYHTTLTFPGPGGRRLTESTTNLASPPTRDARVPVYYVPADPAQFQDARLGPPGVFELIFAAISEPSRSGCAWSRSSFTATSPGAEPIAAHEADRITGAAQDRADNSVKARLPSPLRRVVWAAKGPVSGRCLTRDVVVASPG